MIITITSLKLKTPFHFFKLASRALKVTRQLNSTECLSFKKSGFWNEHFTISAWATKEQMHKFARSGAHLEAMKQSADIAKEIRTLTIEADVVPNWIEAKRRLKEEGKVLKF